MRAPRSQTGSAPRIPLRHAVVLGLLQGPTELLPVSSSAHTALIPRLAGWPHAELDPELRNSIEVALHAGTAAALLIAMRREVAQTLRELDARGLAGTALAIAPPALVGYLLERRIERRPNTPATIAAGLALGGVAMALADSGAQTRTQAEARPRDWLLLGLAQSAALLPGVSRNGATLAVLRARGFTREDSQTLSWRVGLPVILGAAALKGCRLLQRGIPPRPSRRAPPGRALAAPAAPPGRALAAPAAAAFLSTLVCAPSVSPGRRGRPLLPFSIYRFGLAASAVIRRPRSCRTPLHGAQ
jgi:undecaprenyl-diphosphatase